MESRHVIHSTTSKVESDEGSKLSYLIISGGTGANVIATAFGPSPAFVLPVSDDGGSSSEILRCFGGPSIGDIRALSSVPDETDDRFPADPPDPTGRRSEHEGRA